MPKRNFMDRKKILLFASTMLCVNESVSLSKEPCLSSKHVMALAEDTTWIPLSFVLIVSGNNN